MRSLLSAKAPGKGMPKRVTGRALATSLRMPSSKAAGSVPAVHAAQHASAPGSAASVGGGEARGACTAREGAQAGPLPP